MQKESKNTILLTQSFIMDAPDSYWDYRDYVFSLCSNKAFIDQPVRLNVERGVEWVDELRKATQHFGFTNCKITADQPKSWAGYMMDQIRLNPSTWTMPFPGDHIYIEKDSEIFNKYLRVAEEKGVDAISFGHIQDWDYFIDWKRIPVIEDTDEYVIIEWGNKYRYYKNYKFIKLAKKTIQMFLTMPPVPGFMIFKSDFFLDILQHTHNSKRWQDMEYVKCDSTWSYRVLIPKYYLYRHVHGYWAEYVFDVLAGIKKFNPDNKSVLDGMYMRTSYDWNNDMPSGVQYGEKCTSQNITMKKYIEKNEGLLPHVYSPFGGATYLTRKGLFMRLRNLFLTVTIDKGRRGLSLVREMIKKKP